ncbi:hypothetical protein LY76DRAFT_164230 [Colletotrichum caudatum]|nr:hypothetical protein LY76DRAFT_164230 [Colletotrichum caudatum]
MLIFNWFGLCDLLHVGVEKQAECRCWSQISGLGVSCTVFSTMILHLDMILKPQASAHSASECALRSPSSIPNPRFS